MQDSFLQYVEDFESWRDSGFPNVKLETREFIDNVLRPDKKWKMWNHQIEALLRTIYAYEILEKKNCLLNIVTGGGKTAIIAAVIFWLKSVHNINKFLILTPNTIVRARLIQDFKDGMVFKNFEFTTKQNYILLNDLALHVMESGAQPQGILDSGIILGNIQQMYSTNIGGKRNLSYLHEFVGNIAIFNDEAHNTPAGEYTNVLNILSKKSKFRLDTTATPNRADGQEPDSEMIYYYGVTQALEDGIIKSIVVYETQAKLLQLTYTNYETGERKDVTELDVEFKEAEKGLAPFHWILDEEPMRKQIAIALQRHEEQKARAKTRYKPLLFIVTMSIAEGERAKKMLQERFKIKTLLVTQESDEEQRQEAMTIGDFDSKYEAVVSVLMLREGWDVPQVSTILLLRKFSSPVYGQQVIGRGLRKIIRNQEEREILAVVDHPRLEHDWLWRLVAVSKVKQNVTDKDLFDEEEDLPDKPIIQTLVRPEKLIKIPEPEYDVDVDFKKIIDDIPDDKIDEDWKSILENKSYEREVWTIARTRIDSVEMKSLKDKRVELLDAPDEFDFAMIGKYPRDVLEKKFKQELLSVCAGLLRETGFGANLRGILYQVMLNHIKTKIFSGKTLCDVDDDDIEFAMMSMPDIRKNFTKSIVAGIIGTK
ncbi:MAG: DEAD/DEAH box helicase family protein [Thaumarchaeota archaeon]|jgi:type III restriction enzyme|nr:DEAD/DEAH box helicase family protein [Nitrososphaerota archaeon]